MRMRTSLRERRRQVIYVVPNLLTTGNLFCGLYAIMAVFGANNMKAAVALLVALVFHLLDHHILRLGREVKPVLILIVTFVLAFLMVSTIKYTKFKGMKLRAGEGFMYLVWGVIGVMMIVAAIAALAPISQAEPEMLISIALFVLFAAYALSGVVMLAVDLIRRTARRSLEPERPSPLPSPHGGEDR